MNKVTTTNEELSAEIARRLFGMEPHPTLSGWFLNASVGYKGDYSRPTFASDHNAAMGLVVPEMRKQGWSLHLMDNLVRETVIAVFDHPERRSVRAQAALGEEPRAICEAALAALDSQEGKE